MSGILYGYFPTYDPKLQDQKELSDVSDEEFKKVYTPIPSTKNQKIIQWIFFIIFGGWLRIILTILTTIVYLIILSPWMLLCNRLDIIGPYVWIGQVISQYYIRMICFFLGVYWIKWEGKFDKNTRQISYNHTALIDGPMIYIRQIFTVVMMSGVKSVPFFGRIATVSSSIFIDRSKTGQGNSEAISEGLKKKDTWPIAIAPEGKITNGSVVLKFRTGSFLTDEQIQPVAIRYYHLFPWSGTTINWVTDSFWEYMWLCFCMPGAIAHIRIMDPIPSEELKTMEPADRAKMVQLKIANKLGVRAISRTSHAIFAEKKKDE